MHISYRRGGLALLAFVLVLGLMPFIWPRVRADDSSSWLSDQAPALSKVMELGGGVPPESYNTDCIDSAYALPDASIRQVCVFQSPLGPLTREGDIQIGTNKYLPLTGQYGHGVFLPSPEPSMAVVTLPSPQIGNYIGVYRHLSKASLVKITDQYRTYYTVSAAPDDILRDPATGAPLQVSTTSVSYSANGEWMAVNVPGRGLLRVNMDDLSTKLFAKPIEPSWFLGVASPPLAISNDGRFVAANVDIFGDQNLNIYDLSTCDDQLDVPYTQYQWCAGRNIWQGQTLSGADEGQGILDGDGQADLEEPVRLRFVDDQTLSFSARYAVQSPQTYKTASFVVTAPGSVTLHKLGLLGLGDSYISGQGAFEYIPGTDTPINTCHVSQFAYPFLLGKEYFDSYNSVACSGATTDKIVGKDTKFLGQVTDGIKEDNRDKNSILATFQPGYIYQQEFASTYRPEAMLLSVGGDDIGFADIVKRCAAHADTCYSTYEDRAELVNSIDATYSKLVNTYTTLRQQSAGARLYVVGYPQVAKVGGDCGLNVHLNSDEVAFSSQLINYLDSVVQKAAATAGVFYVDTQHAFDGHRLCESGDKAMNALTAGNDAGMTVLGKRIEFIGAESYHPTQLGYQLLANTIAARTTNLSAPMPQPSPYAVPAFDATSPILSGVPSTGRPLNWVINDDTMADDFVLRGNTQLVTVAGSAVQLQPGSAYQIVLHSDPILLDEGGVDANGDVSVTVRIPTSTQPGYHVLHVYGTDMAGEPVDVQKTVYVAASLVDYDGDGVPNDANPCLIVPASGQDVDGDGVDDACDPAITTTAPVAVSGQVSVSEHVAVSSPASDVAVVSAGTQNTTAAVLGDATLAPETKVSMSKVPPNSIKPHLLFTVRWWRVVEIGLGATVLLTLLRYALRRG